MEPRAGTTIGDAYVLSSLLGEGGMGQVWAATAVGSGERVALKLLRHGAPEHRARFEREARAASAVVHPNVRAVRGIIDSPGQVVTHPTELTIAFKNPDQAGTASTSSARSMCSSRTALLGHRLARSIRDAARATPDGEAVDPR